MVFIFLIFNVSFFMFRFSYCVFYGVVVLVSGIIVGSGAGAGAGAGSGAGATAFGGAPPSAVGVVVAVCCVLSVSVPVGVVVEVKIGSVVVLVVCPVSLVTDGVVVAAESVVCCVSITASVPAFIVAPQAPPEVLITPPSIYIQVGEPLVLSYIVTPESAPPPTVSFWVSTLCAVILPSWSILQLPFMPEMDFKFNMEKPLRLRSPAMVVISARSPVPPLAASCDWPRLTKATILPTPNSLFIIPDSPNGSNAIPTVASPSLAFLPTPATDETEIRSPMAMGPFSRFTFTGTRPAKARGACAP